MKIFETTEDALDFLDSQDCYLSNPREIVGGGVTRLPNGTLVIVENGGL